MTLNEIPITPSFLVRFGRSMDRWKAYKEHNLALISLLKFEAKNLSKFFYQNNDYSGRCGIKIFNKVEAPRIDDLIIYSK